MVQNIDSILQRGERLDLLVDKTDTLAGQAYAFRRGARSVRRQQWWRNIRIMALSGVVGVVSDVILRFRLFTDEKQCAVGTLPIYCPVLRSFPDSLSIVIRLMALWHFLHAMLYLILIACLNTFAPYEHLTRGRSERFP